MSARTSSGIVFTLQEVLALTNRVRRLSASFWALAVFVVLLVLLVGTCFFGPWALLRKLPSRQDLAIDEDLKAQLDGIYGVSQKLSENGADIMRARLSLSESRLEWRTRESQNDPEAAQLQQRPEDLQNLLIARKQKLETARQENDKLKTQFKDLNAKVKVEETRLTQELGSSGGALEGELRSFVEKRKSMEEEKTRTQHEIDLLTVGLEEITEQIVRAGVPKEELTNAPSYLQHLEKQLQSTKPRTP